MADMERQQEKVVGEEVDSLLEGMAVVNFDLLCSSVALQTQGKWAKLQDVDVEADGGEFGTVLRMWEDEVLDCFNDRRIALQSGCCPCYRFGENMRRAGFGSCFIQGSDSSIDDCIYHFVCPCCTLSQEARALEMNNVQDGTWHVRGDTLCIGGYGEGSKALYELHPTPGPTERPNPCIMQNNAAVVIALEPVKL